MEFFFIVEPLLSNLPWFNNLPYLIFRAGPDEDQALHNNLP